MTVVAIHQPQYLPWIPYLAKLAASDIFIYLDNVQFQKNGVQNRNQVKTANGSLWLTVPVHGSLSLDISNTRIARQPWAQKHIRTLEMHYAQARCLQLLDGLRGILQQPWDHLGELNISITEWMLGVIGVKNSRVRASTLNAAGSNEELVINLCKEVGATHYLSGRGAAVYQKPENFIAQGLQLDYFDFGPTRPYCQCYPKLGFIPELSAIDAILNIGGDARVLLDKAPRDLAIKPK
jgi:hypothetical protein